MNIKELQNRDQLGHFLSQNNLTGIGVEVGCGHGVYASAILDSWSGTLVMVDPFQKYEGYKELTNETAPFDEWYKRCVELQLRTKRALVLRTFSANAAGMFADNSLDFVYIDGNHGYNYVRMDLSGWWPKVKSGGLFCGHDYGNQTEATGNKGWDCEVQKAIEDWCTFGYPKPHLTPCSSWWIEKP